jgi:hypothetical protein
VPNSVRYDAELGLIAIEIQARIDQGVVKELAHEAARIARQHNCFLVLSDARGAMPGLSTMEIYDLPKVILEILSATGIPAHKFKRALVVSGDLDDFRFFEIVSRNRGQNVTVFHDMDDARSWLFGK